MTRSDRCRRAVLVLLALILAAIACGPAGRTPTGSPAAETPTVRPPTDTSTATLPQDTATPTPPSPTLTPSPTMTLSPEPETATPTLTAWLFVSGTWSGCVDNPTPLVPVLAHPCAGASGNFVTLYLKAHCVIGEYCGNYVLARFESEFILLKLTLLGIQGSVVWMHGEAHPMYSYATTDLTIERAGANVRVEEKGGGQYIHVLPGGCDQVIKDETTVGCSENLA